MTSVRYALGLDYHSKKVQLCLLDADGQVLLRRTCANEVEVIVQAVGRFGPEVSAALESGTGAADLAEQLRRQAGWMVHLAHPGYVARIRQNPDKSDLQDAHLLADLVRVNYLPRVWLAPEPIRELRRLVRYRQQLVEQRRAAKLRIRALLRDQRCAAPTDCRPWTRRWLTWLCAATLSAAGRWLVDQHLEEIERLHGKITEAESHLAEVSRGDPVVARLQQEKGIGRVTAWVMRAEIGQFDRFRSGKQLSRFCGLSPRNASSGQRQADAGLIHAASPLLRTVLIEAGHRLIRQVRRWQSFAARLHGRGKPRSVIVAAVANRWMRGLYHQMVAAAA
jgi:transposase